MSVCMILTITIASSNLHSNSFKLLVYEFCMWYNENVYRMLSVCMMYLSLYKFHIEWKQGKRPYFSMKNVHICILYLIKRWCQTAIMRYVSWSVRQNIWLLVCTWIVILLSQSQLNESHNVTWFFPIESVEKLVRSLTLRLSPTKPLNLDLMS